MRKVFALEKYIEKKIPFLTDYFLTTIEAGREFL